MTMRDRIAAGRLFTDNCEGLPEDRANAKRRMRAFNATGPDDLEERSRLMTEIFGRETKAWIEPPFYFCYGTNIEIGEGTYINFNCSFVDDGKITIGKKVLIGPGVTIGKNSVIGAGSVVTRDIPANVVAAGNPCKVLREIGEKDLKYYYKDREITKEDLEEEARLRNG